MDKIPSKLDEAIFNKYHEFRSSRRILDDEEWIAALLIA